MPALDKAIAKETDSTIRQRMEQELPVMRRHVFHPPRIEPGRSVGEPYGEPGIRLGDGYRKIKLWMLILRGQVLE